MSVEYRINNFPIQILTDFINKNDDLFTPKLSEQVNLYEYIEKIYNKSIIFQIYNNKKLIGIIAAYENQDSKTAFLTLVLCDKDYLHKGFISSLYNYAENYFKQRNIIKIKLETQRTNKAATNFYEKLGYKKIQIEDSKIVYEKNILSENVLLSILCFSYNQIDYIKTCLNGFLMQKANFSFEVLVHDDASTDGTKEIIEEYAKKYPNIIKPFLETENQYSKDNFVSVLKDLYEKCNGKYLAICDGDDYFSDPYKLQKQVDFLEANPDYSICFHPVKVIYDGYDLPEHLYPTEKQVEKGLTLEHLLQENFIQTNSVMYRWAFNDKDIKEFFPEKILPGDWFIHLLHAKEGKIKMLPDVMSVYRRNPQGIWSDSINNEDNKHLKHGLKEIKFYYSVWQMFKDLFPKYYKEIFLPNLKVISKVYFENGRFEELETIGKKYSQYFKDIKFDNQNDEICKLKRKHKKYKKLFNIFLIYSIVITLICLVMLIV